MALQLVMTHCYALYLFFLPLVLCLSPPRACTLVLKTAAVGLIVNSSASVLASMLVSVFPLCNTPSL